MAFSAKLPPAALHLEEISLVKPGQCLARLSELPDHGGLSIELDSIRLLIQRFGDDIVAFENRCPHAGTPLDLFDIGFLDSSGQRLICRTHGATFDPLSGECLSGPCRGDFLRPVAITVNGDRIQAA